MSSAPAALNRLITALFTAISCLIVSCCQRAFAGGADDYFREFIEQRNTDPQAFMLMCGCVGLIVFLALTIFGGFIWFLYFGDRKQPSDKAEK